MVDVYIAFNEDETKVIAEFHMPQNDPAPPGYGVLQDTDSRYIEFKSGQVG